MKFLASQHHRSAFQLGEIQPPNTSLLLSDVRASQMTLGLRKQPRRSFPALSQRSKTFTLLSNYNHLFCYFCIWMDNTATILILTSDFIPKNTSLFDKSGFFFNSSQYFSCCIVNFNTFAITLVEKS